MITPLFFKPNGNIFLKKNQNFTTVFSKNVPTKLKRFYKIQLET